MLKSYREPFNNIFNLVTSSRVHSQGARLLEIGCSKPDNLIPFADLGFSCTGIDPSPLALGGRSRRDIHIFSGYYETTTLEQKMDVIVSRFNLEHILDISRYVEKITDDLKEDGLVFIQVPNIEYYFNNGQPLFVDYEHIQYFNLRSLCALFERFGFSLITHYHDNQPSIIACFGETAFPVSLKAVSLFDRLLSFKNCINNKREKIKKYIHTGDRIVFYGCGLSLYWILYEIKILDQSRVKIADDNPDYLGKYIPCYSLPVHKAEDSIFRDANTVVLTLNPVYHQQVIKSLEKLGLRQRIVIIGTHDIEEIALSES
ncbi:MAG TPA: class I SAM-dependent methyltransferase [archaeon]|nr:class I SAM-dependent methyltransferase [archaeon]